MASTAPVRRLLQPTLYVGGTDDPVVEFARPYVDNLEKSIPNFSRRSCCPGLGTGPSRKRRLRLNRLMTDFLASVDGEVAAIAQPVTLGVIDRISPVSSSRTRKQVTHGRFGSVAPSLCRSYEQLDVRYDHTIAGIGDGTKTHISPGQPNAVHKVLEARVGTKRIEAWPEQDAGVESLFVASFEPIHGLSCVTERCIDHGNFRSVRIPRV
jgi:hypothetical protein